MADLTPTRFYFETRELCHRDVYRHLSILRKSLLELKHISKKALLENNLFWQQEVAKAKQEKDQEWLNRVNAAEEENKQLKKLLHKLKNPSACTGTIELSLGEAENQMDQLNRQLDQKLIHINRLQIALAEQTKEIYELERSYVLLYHRYMRAENLKSKKDEYSHLQSSERITNSKENIKPDNL